MAEEFKVFPADAELEDELSHSCDTDESELEELDNTQPSCDLNSQTLKSLREGKGIFKVVRKPTKKDEQEGEGRYSRKEKSLSQLSKRFLAEFGLNNNQLISMFDVTDRLSTVLLDC